MPHQVTVLHRAFERWPRGHLYADEVGLGKTIEVGLTIREALVRGWAERVLLLVPAAVTGQWQEELAEKLALWVPRWVSPSLGWDWPDGSRTDPDPWMARWPVTLVSSHLARRRRQRDALLARRWDIVAVDEAHHARRSGGKPDGPPNRLLSLLQEMRREAVCQTLLLATATPMQMHPHELWDLVELLDLPGGWADESRYQRYYDEIRHHDFTGRWWQFLGALAQAHREDPKGGRIDPALAVRAREVVDSGQAVRRVIGGRPP